MSSPANKIVSFISILIVCIFTAGCGATTGDSGSGTSESKPEGLEILVGSEMKDIEPMVPEIEKATGVKLYFTYTGTLDGADAVASGNTTAAMAWFANSRYAQLLAQQNGKNFAQDSIMRSPVVMGVKKETAAKFGWDKPGAVVTWSDIATKSSSGELDFAMTNPASSNTGFAALMGVAAATAGDANALNTGNVNDSALDKFFTGQKVTAGSSGWLADTYKERESDLDGMINYESVLLGLNASGDLEQQLTLIYPSEGIVTADYPLMLVDKTHKAEYDKIVSYLKQRDVQTKIMEKTNRRPAVPGVKLAANFPVATLIELPFPSTLPMIDKILFSYLDKHTPPSHTYYVLDTSGSMDELVREEETRMDSLQKSMRNLTGTDQSSTGRFTRFRSNEKVTIITFSDVVANPQNFHVTDARSDGEAQRQIRAVVDNLRPKGGTAIYDALSRAYELAAKDKQGEPDRLYSIVLLIDGELTDGMVYSDFEGLYSSEFENSDIATFTVLFGNSDNVEMNEVADLTNGKVFDGRGSLTTVFKEIRGYQ